MKLKKGTKIAIVLRSGPHNGPFSARWLATFKEGLRLNEADVQIAGYYAVSGSCPTGLLGCINEDEKLCTIWLKLTSEEIVGDKEELFHFIKFLKKFEHLRTMIPHFSDIKDLKTSLSVIRRLKEGHIFSNWFLARLLHKHCKPYLDRIFSPEAAIVKIGAVDFLTGQHIIFSNKIPEHKDHLIGGVVASMCIVPLFNSITVDKPKELKLAEFTHPECDSLLLVDGGYRAGLLLEEAIREPVGYDVIFVVDINGVDYKLFETKKYNLVSRIERVHSITSTTIDRLQLSFADRINAEIAIRDKIAAVRDKLIGLRKLSNCPEKINENINKIEEIIAQMNNGRLRLGDKHAPEVIMVSNPKYAIQFDFTNATSAEFAHLERAGHHAALKTLRELELDTKGIPLIRP